MRKFLTRVLWLISLATIFSVSVLSAAPKYVPTKDAYTVLEYARGAVGTHAMRARGLCQTFAWECLHDTLGVSNKSGGGCCATKAWQTYGVSTSREDIPIGAAVYFGGSKTIDDYCGQEAGHVGIYIGNDEIAHAWSSVIIMKTTIDYVLNCGYYYRGWGWQGGYPLAKLHTCSTDLGTQNYHTSDSGVLGACRECGEPYAWQSTFTKNIQQLYLKSGNGNYKAVVRSAPYEDAELLSDNKVFEQLNALGTVTNAYGNTWYAVDYEDDSSKMCYTAYIYSEHIEKYTDSKPNSSYVPALPKYEQPTITTIVTPAKKNDSGNLVTITHTHNYSYNNGQCYCGERSAAQPEKSTLNIRLTAYPTSLKQGSLFNLAGSISSNYPIRRVTGYIEQGGTVYGSSEDFPNKTSLNVSTAQLNYGLKFGTLSAGNYTLRVEAVDASGQSVRVTKTFSVYEEVKQADSTLGIYLDSYPVSIKRGTSYSLQGSISSNYTIVKASGYIYDAAGSIVQSAKDTPNSNHLRIGTANLNYNLLFGRLEPGNYTLKIEAADAFGKVATATKNFTVQGDPSSSNGGTVLRSGSSGSAVTKLQQDLNRIMGAGLTVDGIFGSGTERAVRDFQARYSLAVDGIAGPDTLSKIRAVIDGLDTAGETPAPVPAKKAITSTNQMLGNGSSGNAVKELQAALNQILNAGLSVDGIFGNGTAKAVKDFQARYGLAVDGIAGPDTLNKINSVLQ